MICTDLVVDMISSSYTDLVDIQYSITSVDLFTVLFSLLRLIPECVQILESHGI